MSSTSLLRSGLRIHIEVVLCKGARVWGEWQPVMEAASRLGLVQALDTMTNRQASCSCGKLTISTKGDPLRISICHCLACQKRTGSAFGVQARFALDMVAIEGESKEYVRIGESGIPSRYHFCPECSSIVFYQLDAVPDVIAVPVGAFADPAFPTPHVSVYEERKHQWVHLPDGIETHD